MKYTSPKYKFIIPCYIYDCHSFNPGDVVSVIYVNVSADNCRDVFVMFKGNEYHVPVDAFLLCTKKI